MLADNTLSVSGVKTETALGHAKNEANSLHKGRLEQKCL